MNLPPLEKRNIKISIGESLSPKLTKFASSHPFTQQIDIVFPSNFALEQAFSETQTSYGKGRTRLSTLVNNAGSFVNGIEQSSMLLILCTNPNSDDAWCIDQRGVLTLSVSKYTYERLGMQGEALPYKEHADRYVIVLPLPLQKNANLERYKTALENWDQWRQRDNGEGLWEVIWCSQDPSMPFEPPILHQNNNASLKPAIFNISHISEVHIPQPNITPRPSFPSDEDEDWNNNMRALFEWVGLACLGPGSQRLKANDRVDPFVAVYEPPSPSHVGDITRLRWRGLLCPIFVQTLIDIAVSKIGRTTMPGSTVNTGDSSLISITSQAFAESPMSYIPSSALTSGNEQAASLKRVPRTEGDDTWSLLVAPNSESMVWALAESLGRWDTRWG